MKCLDALWGGEQTKQPDLASAGFLRAKSDRRAPRMVDGACFPCKSSRSPLPRKSLQCIMPIVDSGF